MNCSENNHFQYDISFLALCLLLSSTPLAGYVVINGLLKRFFLDDRNDGVVNMRTIVPGGGGADGMGW